MVIGEREGSVREGGTAPFLAAPSFPLSPFPNSVLSVVNRGDPIGQA